MGEVVSVYGAELEGRLCTGSGSVMSLFFFLLVGASPALLLFLVPEDGLAPAFLCGYGVFAVDILLIRYLAKTMLEGAAGRLPQGRPAGMSLAWFLMALMKFAGLILILFVILVVWQLLPLPVFGGALYSLIVTGLHSFVQVRRGSGAF